MVPETVMLPCPPRRVIPVGQGAMMVELEDEVVVVRKGYSVLKRVCRPEEPGERLLWPLGEDRCVMLGHGGAAKVYGNDKVVERRPGAFNEDDELVHALSVGKDETVLLLGRMTGNPLLLPTPEYRFVLFKHVLQPAASPKLVLKRKPLGWGVHAGGSRVLVVVSEAGVDKLLSVPLDSRETCELAWPAELAGKRVAGMAVEAARGDLALAIRGSIGGELAKLENPGAKAAAYAALTPAGPEVDQPAWSPDGRSVSCRFETKTGKTLAVVAVTTRLTRTVCSLRDGDEVLWLDAGTVAVIRWDQIERWSLLG